jgi:hypothetical protein
MVGSVALEMDDEIMFEIHVWNWNDSVWPMAFKLAWSLAGAGCVKKKLFTQSSFGLPLMAWSVMLARTIPTVIPPELCLTTLRTILRTTQLASTVRRAGGGWSDDEVTALDDGLEEVVHSCVVVHVEPACWRGHFDPLEGAPRGP